MKRVTIGLMVVASGLAFSMLTAQGCGGSEEPVDAGEQPDTAVPDTAVADTAPPIKDAAKDTAPTCDPNVDPFKNIPDAEVGDSGLTSGVCAACMSSKCKAEIDTCMKDCTCQGPVIDVLECALDPKTPFSQQKLLLCGQGLAGAPASVQNAGFAIAGCLQSKCSNECIPSGFFDGGDGSTDAAGDGG